MLIDVRFRLLLLLCLLPASSAMAQQPEVAAHPDKGRISLDVVVAAKNGPPVAGLEQGDFLLTDNKTARPMTSFRAMARGQEPVEVVLLIDAVNTNYEHVSYERQQIDQFLKANGGKLELPTALAIFTDTGSQMQQTFSRDGNSLADSLDHQTIGLREIRRSAGFYGAEDRLQLSLEALRQLMAREGPRPGRKLVLWVSPGWPLLSGAGVDLSMKERERIFRTIVDTSTAMREAGITLYNLNPLGPTENLSAAFYYENYLKGVPNSGKTDLGDLGLQVLARQSGGLTLTSSNDVRAMLQKAVSDTDAYYQISFEPAPADKPDEYHHIEVKVEKPGLIARTRDGYYAQP
ncbi:VWA domain-containing protein [Granulicella sibirica]|uniref:VWFA-related domain-containing protein n=1 Tax=Granulicella sibirica TaxID=2479048 RepID=A0A4Q0T3C7_9BACT|nr:VWA domain-containing protein [Granulicella sibirica]RXH56051.1 hypothetical protein GRAN_2908 [Granulicella sibirica]